MTGIGTKARGREQHATRSYHHFIEGLYAHLKGGHAYPDQVVA
jgi:hypothetical protein